MVIYTLNISFILFHKRAIHAGKLAAFERTLKKITKRTFTPSSNRIMKLQIYRYTLLCRQMVAPRVCTQLKKNRLPGFKIGMNPSLHVICLLVTSSSSVSYPLYPLQTTMNHSKSSQTTINNYNHREPL